MRFPTVVISGTKLAEEIKTTRSEVWRLVQQLRTLGVEIAGHPSSGYQLTSIPDLLLPELLEPLVRSTIFAEHICHYYRAGSTNTLALEAAAGGAPEGAALGGACIDTRRGDCCPVSCTGDRFACLARSEVAERPADYWEEILRHSD
ncbi:MAG: hypothetical protein DMG93_17420 [Acidobacteria bacterium]|nr:MAG: hypothetical protein DMG93_17420 [Acidobacteriota bacterium]